MPETFKPFDPAEYLNTEEAIASYLEDSADAGPEVMIAALAAVARARNMSALARSADITREGLYKALAPTGNPSFSTVAKIAEAMDLQVVFVKKALPKAKTLSRRAKPRAAA